jgi:hypothetical protein
MRYCIVNKTKFLAAGGEEVGHYVDADGNKIIINENELIRDREKNGTFDELLNTLDGKAYNTTEIKNILQDRKNKFKLR